MCHDLDLLVDIEESVNMHIELLRMLTIPTRQRAIINIDDPFAGKCVQAANKVPIITYSLLNDGADIHILRLNTSIFETNILLNTPVNIQIELFTTLLGISNVCNILAAVSCGIALGAAPKTIVNGIETVDIVPGCLEHIEEGQDFAVIVDRAQTPEMLFGTLEDVRSCLPSRMITVLGCGEETNITNRALIGEIGHYKSDVVIITNDNPGLESPCNIIKDIVAGWPDDLLLQQSWYLFPWYQDIGYLPVWFTDIALWTQCLVKRYIIEDRYLAIRGAIYMASKNDAVVITGKGCNNYQKWSKNYVSGIESSKLPKDKFNRADDLVLGWFDDRVEARNSLSKLPRLNEIFPGLDRSLIPWIWPGLHRRHPLELWDSENLPTISGVQYPMF